MHDRDSPSKFFWKSIFKSIPRNHLKIPDLTVTWAWIDATNNLQNIFHYCSGGGCQGYELCRAVTEAQTSAIPGHYAKDFWRQNQGPVTVTEKDKCKFQSKEEPQRINLEQEQSSVFSFVTLWDCESKM